MTTYDLSRLLNPASREHTLLNRLTLLPAEEKSLLDARAQVRRALRTQLPALIKKYLPEITTVEKPRFVTQGSYAYGTINRLCHTGQQIDMDDGCYLPMSFAKEFDVGYASELFFQAVDVVLAPLAAANGWKLISDKDTCTRLELNPSMHIDVPLYAIPDSDFKQLSESAARSLENAALKGFTLDAQQALHWDDLPRNKVLLAIRGGGWRPSDPRPIIKWARHQAETKGKQWRRVVRYLKAWRDYHWPEGGPTSICLMAAVDEVFSKAQDREDLALVEVLGRLPEVLAGPVYNRAEPDLKEDLSARLDKEGIRADVCRKLESFHIDLKQAIAGNVTKEDACHLLKKHMGSRIPFVPEWITTVTATHVVRNTPAAKNSAAPTIRSTKSG